MKAESSHESLKLHSLAYMILKFKICFESCSRKTGSNSKVVRFL